MKSKIHALTIAAGILGGSFPGQAWAHAHLKRAVPAPDSVVAAPPEEVRIEFDEKVEASMSTIQVIGPDGAVANNGKAAVDPSAPTTLVVKLARPLPPGGYEARWRAVGMDSHPMKGVFKFEVRP